MSLIRRPNNSLSGFPRLFEDFFGRDVFNSPFFQESSATVPAVNIRDNDENYVLELAAPGMKKEDFHVSLQDRLLTISSESKSENTEEKENFSRKEFSYSSFKRSFTLPESVDQDNISANYTDGLLSLTIPKREEIAKETHKLIEIQ